MFIAQIVLDSDDSDDSANFGRIATEILAARRRWVNLLVSTRNGATIAAWGASLAAMCFVPIVGVAAVGVFIGTIANDIMESSKLAEIQSKWANFREKHRSLRRIEFV